MSHNVDPSTIRQQLLQLAFLPLVSVLSTHNADAQFQRECENPLILALVVLRRYGNTVKYGLPSQAYRITNSQLITKSYGSFPVRFEPSLPELLTVHNPAADDKLAALFSISSLELLLKNMALLHNESLYLGLFKRIIASNRVLLFNTFNHPVAQIFIVDYDSDPIDTVRSLIVDFRNYSFPKYFQNLDILIHIFVVYNPETCLGEAVAEYQASLRSSFSVTSTAVPFKSSPEPKETVNLADVESSTISQEIQMSLQPRDNSTIQILPTLDATLRSTVYDFISRHLVPHMERKIRTWDDSVLAPKKLITGRFFSASKKLFNNNSSSDAAASTIPGAYNHTGNFYHRSAPEQIMRKLADWALMLKDFKYAYSTYDLIKKDYTNDKAWLYVASTQEMCIVSLLLAQTQPLASDTLPQRPDKNTLRKIRHDIIEPYVDNLTYTYKSRYNVKTYAIRSCMIVAELLLNMSIMFNIPWWWSDLTEGYLVNAWQEFENHLCANGDLPLVTRAVLFERLGFVKMSSSFVPSARMDVIEDVLANGVHSIAVEEPEEGHYKNDHKLLPYNDNAVQGLTRFRKSCLWYILAMKEWVDLENPQQVQILYGHLNNRFSSKASNQWFDRPELILALIKLAAKV